jgi:hypothetical protein
VSQRTFVPPRDPARRRRYYGLLGAARKAPPHQKQKLLALARSLLEPAPGERLHPREQLS